MTKKLFAINNAICTGVIILCTYLVIKRENKSIKSYRAYQQGNCIYLTKDTTKGYPIKLIR